MLKKTTESGHLGEDLAVKHLLNQSYQIIERNFHICGGEIDIIAQDGNELVFAEVKLRNQGTIDEALLSITRSKQKKIIKTALQYIATHEEAETLYSRFDIIIILKEKDQHYHITHFKNAFEGEADY